MTITRNPFPHTSVFLSIKFAEGGVACETWRVGLTYQCVLPPPLPLVNKLFFMHVIIMKNGVILHVKTAVFCSIPTFVHPVYGETATSCDLALLHLHVHVCTWLYVCGWHMYLALSSCTINRIGWNYIGDRGKAALTEAAKTHSVDVDGLEWVHMFTTLTSMHNNNACAQDVSK